MTSTATPPDSSPTAAAAPPARRRSVTAAMCACVLVAQSLVAAMNLAIPKIAASGLHPSPAQLLWIVDTYVLVFAGLLIPAGALGDRPPRLKRRGGTPMAARAYC
ncbi:hypothetical protein ACTPOK_35595 [Streptomyces inhibens]|uniref:hypothetical protein n=1 Tax=Streptomyces inhibens TaxID=2293571 RepID=UPI00402A70FD